MEVEELPAACHVDEIVEGVERPLLPQKGSQHNLSTQIDMPLQFDEQTGNSVPMTDDWRNPITSENSNVDELIDFETSHQESASGEEYNDLAAN